MLPAASSVPFGSSPSSRRIQRIQNPSACNWIQPPTPILAHSHNHNANGQIHGQLVNNNISSPSSLGSPYEGGGFGSTYGGQNHLTKEQTIMSDAGSKEKSERMRQTLPFPNAMSADAMSAAALSNPIFRASALAELQTQSSSRAPFPFNQVPSTTFSTSATAGAFVFSGGYSFCANPIKLTT